MRRGRPWKKEGGGGGGGGRDKGKGGERNWTDIGDPRGFPGLLIMCDEGREKRASLEVLDLLTEDIRALLGGNPGSGSGSGSGEVEGGESGAPLPAPPSRPLTVAEELAKELEEAGGDLEGSGGGPGGVEGGEGGGKVKAIPTEKFLTRLATQPARFMDLGTRAMGLLWVTEPGFDVVAWVDGLFAKAKGSGSAFTRYVSRILPAQRFVTAEAGAIGGAVKELFSAAFPPTARETTYKVEVRIRNSGKCEKHTVMNAITGAVGSRHMVMLDDPQTVILVEVIKHLASVAVITDRRWARNNRYNLRLACETEEQREARVKSAAALQEAGVKRRREEEERKKEGGGGGGGEKEGEEGAQEGEGESEGNPGGEVALQGEKELTALE